MTIDITVRKGPLLVDNPTAAPSTAPPDSAAGSAPASSGAESSPPETASPQRPTDADLPLLVFAQQYELTLRDLYAAALASGADDGEHAAVYRTLRSNHEGYGNAVSALLGVGAVQGRDDELFEQLAPQFDGGDADALAAAAYDAESQVVATHRDIVARLDGVTAAKTLSSVLIVESQHCVVLADIAGKGDDLDALLTNTARSIAPAGGTSPPAGTAEVAGAGSTEPSGSLEPGESTGPETSGPDTSAAASSAPDTTEG